MALGRGVASNSIQNQVADNGEKALGRLPEERSVGVLVGSVPGPGDEEKARGDVALEEPLEGAKSHELRPVVACADAEKADSFRVSASVQIYVDRRRGGLTPADYVDGQDAADVVSL